MKTKRLEAAWKSYYERVIPKDAPPAQIKTSKWAFFAGASAIYFTLMNTLSDGHEVTSEDLDMMRDLRAEMHEFNEAVRAGRQ